MGLHFWLLPLMAILSVSVWIFYMAIRYTGGPGVRSDGRTVVDKPVHDDNSPLG
jgi:hypothetical protein